MFAAHISLSLTHLPVVKSTLISAFEPTTLHETQSKLKEEYSMNENNINDIKVMDYKTSVGEESVEIDINMYNEASKVAQDAEVRRIAQLVRERVISNGKSHTNDLFAKPQQSKSSQKMILYRLKDDYYRLLSQNFGVTFKETQLSSFYMTMTVSCDSSKCLRCDDP